MRGHLLLLLLCEAARSCICPMKLFEHNSRPASRLHGEVSLRARYLATAQSKTTPLGLQPRRADARVLKSHALWDLNRHKRREASYRKLSRQLRVGKTCLLAEDIFERRPSYSIPQWQRKAVMESGIENTR